MNNTLPIELDYKNLKVVFKKKTGEVLDTYHAVGKMNKRVYSNRVLFQCAVDLPYHSKVKEFSKKFTEEYGYTPYTTLKIIDKLRWKMLLGEDQWMTREQLWRWCRGVGRGGKILIDRVMWCHENKELILQLLVDKQENLIPLFYSGRESFTTVRELKEFLGKSVWKKIINNSFTRNQLIMFNSLRWVDNKYILDLPTVQKNLELPSGYLKQYRYIVFVSGKTHYHICGKLVNKERVVCNKYESEKLIITVKDTMGMLRQLGKEYNPNWSWKRWQEEHDKASKEILAGKFSVESFTEGIYSHPKILREYSLNGCKAVLLDSPLAVATEGKQMHHCVGGYVNQCQRGKYLVYSITDGKEERSTIGLTVNEVNGDFYVLIQQHYGKCNSVVSQEVKAFGTSLCKEINDKLMKGDLK